VADASATCCNKVSNVLWAWAAAARFRAIPGIKALPEQSDLKPRNSQLLKFNNNPR